MYSIIASSNLSPAALTEVELTTPPNDKTATSDVPPPISTTIDPVGSATGRPAPIAAATGSSIKYTFLAPAASADSLIALLSTFVAPEGTQITICGFEPGFPFCAAGYHWSPHPTVEGGRGKRATCNPGAYLPTLTGAE